MKNNRKRIVLSTGMEIPCRKVNYGVIEELELLPKPLA